MYDRNHVTVSDTIGNQNQGPISEIGVGAKFFFSETKIIFFQIIDSPFEMWFQYWLRYRLKVSAKLGFGFSIGPKPK